MEQQGYLNPPGPDIPQDVVAFWKDPIETLKRLHAAYGPVVAFDPKTPLRYRSAIQSSSKSL